MPLISVILPTYNRQQFLPEAMNSILEQTFKDLELIVADDGSTDETSKIVQDYCLRDPRVIYLPLPHTGRSHARNKALEIARGEYIAFQDSDDISLPERLQTLLDVILKQPDIVMVYSSTLYMDSRGSLLADHYIVEPTADLYREIIFKNYRAIVPMTAMIRASILADIGSFDENLDRFEDLDFILRIAKYGSTHAIVRPLLKARLHDENAMPSQKPQEVLRNLDTFTTKVIAGDAGRTRQRMLKAGLAKLYLIYANETSKIFRLKDSAPFYRRAFLLSPDIRQIVWFLLAALRLIKAGNDKQKMDSTSNKGV